MTIKIIIIEDENLAISRLKRLLADLTDDFIIVQEIKSVQEGVQWFLENSDHSADLIFSDIQLLDGLSFEIYEKLEINTPIIFTTAFDEYVLKAFKTCGIEYLLKPFSIEELTAAIKKFKVLINASTNDRTELPNKLKHLIHKLATNEFPTLIAYVKEKLIPINTADILYFSLDTQCVFAHTLKNKWSLHESLNQIQEKLPTHYFFRANRQYIVNRKYIQAIANDFNGKLKIELVAPREDIVVSKDNAKNFKDWLQQ